MSSSAPLAVLLILSRWCVSTTLQQIAYTPDSLSSPWTPGQYYHIGTDSIQVVFFCRHDKDRKYNPTKFKIDRDFERRFTKPVEYLNQRELQGPNHQKVLEQSVVREEFKVATERTTIPLKTTSTSPKGVGHEDLQTLSQRSLPSTEFPTRSTNNVDSPEQILDGVIKNEPISPERSKYYKLYQNVQLNFFDAMFFCNARGMGLASINSPQEQEVLATMIKHSGLIDAKVWTSGSDLSEYNNFVWSNSGRPFTFTSWGAGQPSHLIREESGEVQHCVRIEDSGWSNWFCSDRSHFACEFFF